MLSKLRIKQFQKKILAHFRDQGREFPWRTTRDPYRILVSEVMLQQTQTERVRSKYIEFLDCFPSFTALAQASRADVLKAWQGLGYNRRALALHACAKEVLSRPGGTLPRDRDALLALPGIGPYTASAVACFSWSERSAFIETNIRTVFIHEFFPKRRKVADSEILELIAETLPRRDVRSWYYALMDYGAWLKRSGRKFNSRSAHYVKQSAFEGSHRQLRGRILRELTRTSGLTIHALHKVIARPKAEVLSTIDALVAEGFLVREGLRVRLGD
ncbi:MAG: A/G-specific adenine glycosylase [Deltaproteobacteria bacterium]|nr:A/G-specific adenine glycosylase [Deltaproteobacteria bacterium]